MNRRIRVCIIYPADPVGVIPGGIDTFIRGIIRWAPEDIEVSLVGVSTDTRQRPIGTWTECDAGRRTFRFYPVASLLNPEGRGRIPLSVRFSMGLLRRRPKIEADVLEFHRIEPSLLFVRDRRAKNMFVHQNMKILKNPDADILWSRIPGLFYWLEGKLIRYIQSVYAVREDAVEWYKERYPAIQERFNFIPTWYDPEIFYPVSSQKRTELRQEYGFQKDEKVFLFVGRLDTQKDPLLLLEAFREAFPDRVDTRLVYVGDGVLRDKVESRLCELPELSDRVALFGLRSAAEIANLLRAVDVFALSSAYEGMPMCVLEALGSGVPVVSTDVGEVRRVVKNGVNGTILEGRTQRELAESLSGVLDQLEEFRGDPYVNAVALYTPEQILRPVYENYRALAKITAV